MQYIDYKRQANSNIFDFCTNNYFESRRNVLFKIMHELKKQNVNFALGCSSNLFFRGIVDDFNDFDIIFEKKYTNDIIKIMSELGGQLVGTGGNGFCESDMYLHYILDSIHIDFISGFRINTFDKSYYYDLSNNEVENLDSEYFQIPLVPSEIQLILYAMMEGWQPRRRFKRVIIYNYLNQEGVIFPKILEDCLKQDLPDWIKKLIQSLL